MKIALSRNLSSRTFYLVASAFALACLALMLWAGPEGRPPAHRNTFTLTTRPTAPEALFADTTPAGDSASIQLLADGR